MFKPFAATIALLALFLVAACQGPEQQAEPVPKQQAEPVQGTSLGMAASRIEDYKMPPADIQELVNRSHAVVVGTISAVSEPVSELPYGTTKEDFPDWPGEDWSNPYYEVIYFDITIEEVLLDDGNIRDNARLRLGNNEWEVLPQVGKRYLFALGVAPDNKSYGIAANWNLLSIEGGIRKLDGTPAGFVGVTDETKLLEGARTAALNYDFIPYSEWPDRFYTGAGDAGESES